MLRLCSLRGPLVAFFCLWLAAAPLGAETLSRIEVRLAEVAYGLGQTDLRVRLNLTNGISVEFKAQNPRDIETTLRMVDMFVSGRARMYAELDGDGAVRAIQIAGPVR